MTFEDVIVLKTLFAADGIRFTEWFDSVLVAYANQFEEDERDAAYVNVFTRVGEEF